MNDRVKEIEERCKAATSGEWTLLKGYDACRYVAQVGRFCVVVPHGRAMLTPDMVDANFIAHAREDIPFLLHELKVLERALLLACTDCADGYRDQGAVASKWADRYKAIAAKEASDV